MPEVLVSHAIELAVAPVFLLTGIAGLLAVMTSRLACPEITHLGRRRRLASWAINFCAAGALLVCLVIVTLFVDDLFATDLRVLAGALFVCALAALIGGLACFLREVYLATQAIGIETARFEHQLGSR